MLIKVCGMRDPENISRLSALDIHWMGFIFYGASKRFTEYVPERCRDISRRWVFLWMPTVRRCGIR
jgi:phosphoribosylanthranilate isomerase (EC 5.3.1.24)